MNALRILTLVDRVVAETERSVGPRPDAALLNRVVDPIFGPLPILRNAPRSKVDGAEVDLTCTPLDGLYLSAAATYLKAIPTLTPDTAVVAGSILCVDQQHVAVLNYALGEYPVPDTFATTKGAASAS